MFISFFYFTTCSNIVYLYTLLYQNSLIITHKQIKVVHRTKKHTLRRLLPKEIKLRKDSIQQKKENI